MTKSSFPRIAVTGGTGFVGRHLLTALLDQGYQVSALVRDAAKAGLDPGVRTVVGDLKSSSSLAALMYDADVLIHVAGAIMALDRKAFFETNAEGCKRVAEAASFAGVKRIILVSSLAARAPQVSDYAASKRAGEDAMTAEFRDGRLVILRPAAIYGPGDVATIPLFKALTQSIAILPGRAGNRFSLLHVTDFVNVVVDAIGNGRTGIHEIDDGKTGGYDWQELMAISQNIQGNPQRVMMLPKFLPMAVGAISELIAKLRGRPSIVTRGKISEIYFGDWVVQGPAWLRENPIDVQSGFAETFSWYMERGALPKRAIKNGLSKDKTP